MYFSVLQCKCIFFTNDWKWGKKKTSLKSNIEYLLVQTRPNYFNIRLSSFLLKKFIFYLSPNADMLPMKMGGARICGLCVFCSAFNSFTNFFFLLVTTPGVIIKREFNSKTVSETIPGEPITLD